jgi:DNA adenine methylase
MSGAVSRWLGSVDGLSEIIDRILRVQIECRPAIECIKLYDSEKTLFYCDPPYPHCVRPGSEKAYAHEMTDNQHIELSYALNKASGMVAVSGYECDLMDDLYPGKKWRKMFANPKKNHASKTVRQEVLWINYNVAASVLR